MTQSRLPRWNLKAYYDSPEDPKIDGDIASYVRFCRGFKKRYEGKVSQLSDTALVQAIDRYHSRADQCKRLGNYAALSYERNQQSSTTENLYHKVMQKLQNAEELIDFFEHELTFFPKERIRQFSHNPDIDAKYKFYVNHNVKNRPHILSLAEERIYGRLVPLVDGMDELYSQINTNQEFRLGKRQLNYSDMRSRMDIGTHPQMRKKAFEEFIETIKPHRTAYEAIIDAGIKSREEARRINNYKQPMSRWNHSNDIDDDELPLRMVKSVKNSGVTQRFFATKAKRMGKAKLDPWDIVVPLPEDTIKRFSWDDAKEIIIASFSHFHPELGTIARKAFEEHWIDAAPAPDKYSGLGFTLDGSKKFHPSVLVNWYGSMTDLMALTHEVGHAVAMYTQTQNQGNFLSETSMMVAELTALFAERMVSEEMERRAKTPKEKFLAKFRLLNDHHAFYLLRAYEYDATVKLQKSYQKENCYHFDAALLDDWWADTMKETYGNTVRNREQMAPLWAAKYHLFSDPFYIGDYAMSCLIAQVLFDKYHTGEIKDLPNRFMNLLKKGSTDYSLNLIEGLGVDVKEKGFWKKGTDGIHREIDALELLIEQEKNDKSHRQKNSNFSGRLSNADQKGIRGL